MPRIRFILVRCPHCGEGYKVRLERIESREPLECTACGDGVDISELAEALAVIHRYSEAVIQLEAVFEVNGDVVSLPEEPPRRPGRVTVPLRPR